MQIWQNRGNVSVNRQVNSILSVNRCINLRKITEKGEAVGENREQEKVNNFFFKTDTECL